MALTLTRNAPSTRSSSPEPRLRWWPVVALSAAVAIIATIQSHRTNAMLIYSDARAHLDIARHVTDGLRPGLVQLGSVWLPLPHLLLVPFVAIRPLWHSGFAGAIVGGLCFVYSALRLFTLIEDVSGSRIGAWCGLAIYATNVNLLYLQSTALTEPVLLAFIIGATYHFSRWMHTKSTRELTWAAALTMCATLARYDGWPLLVAGVVIVALMSPRSRPRDKHVEANFVLFATIGSYGIVLWLLYNLIIFHDALYFLHSSYSAEAQQKALAAAGALPTKSHLLESVLTYSWTVIGDLGWAVVVVGVIAVVAALVIPGPARRRSIAIMALLGAPVVFNVLSLWLGQSTIRVPERPPFGMMNDRYGVVALPLLAVAAGLLVARVRWTAIPVIATAAIALATFSVASPLTVRDGRLGVSTGVGGLNQLAAKYLSRNYHGGEVLADDADDTPFIFASGLDLKEFVTVGFQPWYDDAMRDPAAHVEWIAASDNDAIDQNMHANPDRFSAFRLVFTDPHLRIYRRT